MLAVLANAEHCVAIPNIASLTITAKMPKMISFVNEVTHSVQTLILTTVCCIECVWFTSCNLHFLVLYSIIRLFERMVTHKMTLLISKLKYL